MKNKKKYIVVTGGAGFIGSNLIEYLLSKKIYKIISIDNYSSGSIKNHIRSSKVIYVKSEIKNIKHVLKNIAKKLMYYSILENFQESIKALKI